MMCFSNKSYELTQEKKKKKGILEIAPISLKGSSLCAMTQLFSCEHTACLQSCSLQIYAHENEHSPKCNCQHSSKRRQKLCITQHSRSEPEPSITDTKNR